jgi:hypothetical protein
MRYEPGAAPRRSSASTAPDLTRESRRALVTEKGGDRAYVHRESPTARQLDQPVT